MLNYDTLKQFFIKESLSREQFKGVFERNPQTLVDPKRSAKEIESLDRDREILWRSKDELIPQYIFIRPRVVVG